MCAVNSYLPVFIFIDYSFAFVLIKKIVSFFLNNCLNKMSYYACLYIQKLKWHILILFEILFPAFSPLRHPVHLSWLAEEMRPPRARFLNHFDPLRKSWSAAESSRLRIPLARGSS